MPPHSSTSWVTIPPTAKSLLPSGFRVGFLPSRNDCVRVTADRAHEGASRRQVSEVVHTARASTGRPTSEARDLALRTQHFNVGVVLMREGAHRHGQA